MSEKNAFVESWKKKLLEEPSQAPDDETAGDAAEHLEECGNDEVHEVLPAIAVGPCGEVDVTRSVFVISYDDVTHLRKLIEGRHDADGGYPTYSVFRNLAKAAFVPVEDLQGLKNTLLLMVESYKALLICHLVLLMLTIAVLVASRA